MEIPFCLANWTSSKSIRGFEMIFNRTLEKLHKLHIKIGWNDPKVFRCYFDPRKIFVREILEIQVQC